MIKEHLSELRRCVLKFPECSEDWFFAAFQFDLSSSVEVSIMVSGNAKGWCGFIPMAYVWKSVVGIFSVSEQQGRCKD